MAHQIQFCIAESQQMSKKKKIKKWLTFPFTLGSRIEFDYVKFNGKRSDYCECPQFANILVNEHDVIQSMRSSE